MVSIVIERDNPFDVNLYLDIIIIITILDLTQFHTISHNITQFHAISHNFTQFHAISHNFTQFLLMKDHEVLTVERHRLD